ncbi:oligosaccharide flippase family protein [Candidatus Daviesbacteria bacterium]|nr:oligosaccharide flippase family protein [Candidatus Daviesbacteria bacterium]
MQRAQAILSDKFISGNFLMFFGAMFLNAGGYIYHFLMIRFLGPQDYGALAALFSILYILIAPAMVLNAVVVRFVAQAFGRDDIDFIASFFSQLTRYIFLIGGTITLVFIAASAQIGHFLNIANTGSVMIVGATSLFLFATMFNRSIFQGLTRFGIFTLSGIMETVLKVVLALTFVAIGFSVFGAIGGILIADAAVFITTFVLLKIHFAQNNTQLKLPFGEIIRFTIPVFFSLVAMTSFYSTDIILVKHFFSPLEAGYYAFLALAGKIIFFVSSSVVMVMFPMVAQKKERGEKYTKYFLLTLLSILVISGSAILIYFFFPELIVFLFQRSEYLAVAPLLGIFGVFILLFALCWAAVNFFLSIGLVKISILPIIFAVLQVIGIWFFHGSLLEVIKVSIISLSLLLSCLLLYFAHAKTYNKIH